MTYTYPDKDDRLTCQLIEKEFDGEYCNRKIRLMVTTGFF